MGKWHFILESCCVRYSQQDLPENNTQTYPNSVYHNSRGTYYMCRDPALCLLDCKHLRVYVSLWVSTRQPLPPLPACLGLPAGGGGDRRAKQSREANSAHNEALCNACIQISTLLSLTLLGAFSPFLCPVYCRFNWDCLCLVCCKQKL